MSRRSVGQIPLPKRTEQEDSKSRPIISPRVRTPVSTPAPIPVAAPGWWWQVRGNFLHSTVDDFSLREGLKNHRSGEASAAFQLPSSQAAKHAPAVAVVGDSFAGKSALLNTLQAAWDNTPYTGMRFVEGVRGVAGTFLFDGPLTLKNNRDEPIVHFYDTMGFEYLQLNDVKQERECVDKIVKLHTGELVPGDLLTSKIEPAYRPALDLDFERLDLVLIAANWEVPAAIPWAVRIHFLLRDQGIRSMIVITHVPPGRESRRLLPAGYENVTYCAIDSYTRNAPTTPEQNLQALRVVANCLLLHESQVHFERHWTLYRRVRCFLMRRHRWMSGYRIMHLFVVAFIVLVALLLYSPPQMLLLYWSALLTRLNGKQ